jgi:CRP-like cAMP-binding protein
LTALPAEEHQRLFGLAQKPHFARHEVLCRDGGPASSIHVIRRGQVVVRLGTPDGEQVAVGVLGPGEMVGELALLEGSVTRAGTVVALGEVETWAIPATAFNDLRKRIPELGDYLVGTLAGRLRRMNQRLLDALFMPAGERVLSRLAEVAAAYHRCNKPIIVPLGQRDLAELAGTTPETTNRVLRREAARGTVELARGRITVIDAARLVGPGSGKLQGRCDRNHLAS